MGASTVAAALGQVGLPAPLAELTARAWDAVVVGGGHNGLTAAAYLARAGRSVLVLERRERLGGACTLEQPFDDPGYLVSPCAYVVGLLDQTVIDELGLERYGYKVFVADPNLWVPFADGTSLAQFVDHDRTVAHLRANRFSERDIQGMLAYEDMFDRLRLALRTGPEGDSWQGGSPTREQLEKRLGHDRELVSVLFEESIADTLDRYVTDQRMKDALYGQGVIGAWAGPRDPGTASIKLMHYQGDLGGRGPLWGYVEGGMGQISFAIAQAARDLGAQLATGVPVAEIVPGEGVRLEGGELIRAATVISNADPKRTLGLVDPAAVPGDFRARVDGWQIRSPVVKLNAALERLPTFPAAAGSGVEAHRAMVDVTRGLDAAQEAFEDAERGLPNIGFAEVYFQTAYDPSVAPPGRHLVSVFAQYAPYDLAEGDWDGRRAEIGRLILDAMGEFAPDLPDCVVDHEVLGPPDIERRIGLTGGHIFQGETMPDQMWEHRLTARTPVPGLYLCGAATHPAGSVIALNGRNAAMAVLADTTTAWSRPAADEQ
ncbi:MAG TPA: NAD(P)/FAD-dependent oxidoreductase [Actinomycetota bacterium]|jgi:phytoene dehydrogenase-like protein|nr:NAD(P)/FAD-dependent oxidoreductase [Actinomycetota bacterium]